ncbi:MAG: AbrB/MazE/SpoVT family DNA-binding domain-containing protein [Lachnospiraceae bacterium]
MEENGIVRKIDRAGRTVIPKELRQKYNLKTGDMVEIYTEDGCICLKKYEVENNIIDQAEVLHKKVERMEQELKATQELEEYLKLARSKLEQLQDKT